MEIKQINKEKEPSWDNFTLRGVVKLNNGWSYLKEEFFGFTREWFNFHMTPANSFEKRSLMDWPSTYYCVHISSLIGAELLIDNIPVSIFKRAAIGTLVFGRIGTLAGIVSGATAKPKTKVHVALQIDDLRIASFTFKCKDIGVAYRVLNTLSLMEKEYYNNNPQELKSQQVSNPQDGLSHENKSLDEIIKLKNMLDEGVIDQDEFKVMKSAIISKYTKK